MTRPPVLKKIPQDFIVEEIATLPAGAGEHSVYRLRKRSIGTIEAMDLVARTWSLSRKQIAWGGMKDRHAVTEQLVTIHRGPEENLHQATVELEFVGKTRRPITANDISANRFRITLRDIDPASCDAVEARLARVAAEGIPNAFDDQRFRSLGPSGEFIAKAWIEERYEDALRLAFAEENASDTREEAEQKQILRDHWGRWTEAKAALARSHRRSIITYLCDHPADFRGAFILIRRDLRSLWLSAWQSYIWNKMLEAAAARGMTLASLAIPLPSARSNYSDPAVAQLLQDVLAPMGLDATKLRIKHGRDVFFARGARAALLRPTRLESEWDADDLHRGRRKVRLSFELPRGAYATLLVKELQDAAVGGREE